MSRLILAVQRHLDFASLKKQNPNHQKTDRLQAYNPQLLDQALISSVLAGIYQFTREEKAAGQLLRPLAGGSWLELIFNGYPRKLEQRIADYTLCGRATIRQFLFLVAEKAVKEIRAATGPGATGRSVRSYLTGQRIAILTRLPSELEVGALLHNTTLDDPTNKMHGPFSDFMHWVETYLAAPETPLY